MFEAPGKPIARAVDHRINLLNPTAPPPCPRLYKISEDELLAVKCTISDYIDKGWISPSSSHYRHFIRSYTKIAAPLTDILHKHESFSFGTA